MSETLRRELEDITQTKKWEDLPPSIRIIEYPQPPQWQFNCFAYALGLQKVPPFLIPYRDCFIYSPCVRKLISKKELVRVIGAPKINDIVLYSDGSKLTHAGIIASERLINSKWSNGPVLSHPLWEVPASYGSRVTYYQGMTSERAFQLCQLYQEFNVDPDQSRQPST